MTSSVPTRLVFLADLPKLSKGDKVRFLGCVDSYDTVSETLSLRHNYQSIDHEAKVNIQLVREELPRSATDVGAWLTIVGYVDYTSTISTAVQATMLRDVGPFKIGDYERALQARKDASTTG